MIILKKVSFSKFDFHQK